LNRKFPFISHCSILQDDSDEEEDEPLAFHEMGLDDRILKSIAKLGWSVPTIIQVWRPLKLQARIEGFVFPAFKLIFSSYFFGSFAIIFAKQ
jgi:hypothetical protein